ncbi:sigma 54-interacting transcriptional regulator [Ramlibacter sp.]|uniref:sigma-54-dependent transcriptional regulator n=1 Tax=Ramlibacter sp. TaxID=1917967 RepID=UPI0017D36CD7|nr:sigma 54-interacting transcriptional regulator [Ramlibacter sp.]MBA2676648.1 sigma-54-dependent Fis family transcriptional regulator [Ramlibacter sp.]
MKTARKLLYVSSHPCPPAIEEVLHERGWELVAAASLRATCALLRREAIWAGLLVVDSDASARSIAADFEACRDAADACEWVALLPPGAMQAPVLRDMVVRHFFDHHTAPADPHFLAQSLGHAHGRAQLRHAARSDAPDGDDLGLTGGSTALAQLRRLVRRAALADTPVLITGEPGSGKERIARALHACSPRADAPFVVIDCATTLHAEAAALLQDTESGTLLLDHVGELPLDWQVRLLRLMVERAAARSRPGRGGGLRIVAATDVDLSHAVAARHFREDLFYRLNVVGLAVPPLRNRKEDIPELARQFHADCARDGSGSRGFSRQALAAMAVHTWPGNVRELFNRVQRAVVMAERRTIGAADLGLQAAPAQPLDNLETTRVRAEKDAISLSLDRFSHNVTLAARELGVSRMTLYRLMAKHSIATRSSAPQPQ